MRRIDLVMEALQRLYQTSYQGISSEQIARELGLHRANVSNDLNILVREGKAQKKIGRPVLFKPAGSIKVQGQGDVFDTIIGAKGTLSMAVQQGKAAIIYPPHGLHTLIFGETGVGKTLFAELMYNYGRETGRFSAKAPFMTFNCADYSQNPQLLMGQIFGIKKGAYTGAVHDQAGQLERADEGILFLDEVHRLPAEGQEMLFTFIDKGKFKRLGEPDYTRQARVLIIAATTEEPKSSLLDTFIRRIPMMINIPPLRDRRLCERFKLIRDFFRQESARIGKEIIVSLNALRGLLLYECPNNIGQLKSDIQLSCARAFLDLMSQTRDTVMVNSRILPDEVKKGILKLKDYREEINQLLGDGKFQYKFCAHQEEVYTSKEDQYSVPNNFYELMEKRVERLRKEGINDEDISEIMGTDIENYFINFMGRFKQRTRDTEVEKLIGRELLDLSKEILALAKARLKNPHLDTLLYGLAMHIGATQERIRQQKPIVNPNLNEARKKYAREFTVAVEAASMIEERLNIELPLDEIGFLTMFFVNRQFNGEIDKKIENVGILLLMHGNSAAASIAKVANTLLSCDLACAIDMPLTVNPEKIYQEAKGKVKKIDRGKGVLILADMGSLINFGDMITKETGIVTKTVEMVSTPMVIEAVRKAMMGASLEQVYHAAIDINPYLGKRLTTEPSPGNLTKNVIITGCYTGEGGSVKIKSYILKNIDLTDCPLEVIPLSFCDLKDFKRQINRLSRIKNIIAVISYVNPEIPIIPFFTLEEIFTEQGRKKLQEIVYNENLFLQVADTLTANLNFSTHHELVYDIKTALMGVGASLKIQLNNDVLIGVILHIGCLFERLLNNLELKTRKLEGQVDHHSQKIVKKALKVLEEKYQVTIPHDEIQLITSIFLDGCRAI